MQRVVVIMMFGFMLFSFGIIVAFGDSLSVNDLQGSWRLVEINSQPVPPTSEHQLPVFTIKNQSIEGFDGCNSFWGRLDQPDSITSTRMGCVEGFLKLPLDLTNPLSHLKTGRIDNEILTLPKRKEIPPSVFERME
jgi:heat shock protein HslJ